MNFNNTAALPSCPYSLVSSRLILTQRQTYTHFGSVAETVPVSVSKNNKTETKRKG